jgi:hypothetical protein
MSEAGWQCLPWLQYAGVVRGLGELRAVEVRRCVCTAAIAREVSVPRLIEASVPASVEEAVVTHAEGQPT